MTASVELAAHPYADQFPMLDEERIRELADSIAANGQRTAIILTADGLIIDGRNRAAACALIGVKPWTEVYDGDDIAEYVIDCNATRRHMSNRRPSDVDGFGLDQGRSAQGRPLDPWISCPR